MGMIIQKFAFASLWLEACACFSIQPSSTRTIQRPTHCSSSLDEDPFLNGHSPRNVDEWREKYGDPMQNPPPRKPNKGDLYSDEELQRILDLHNQLSEEITPPSSSADEKVEDVPTGISSIHDLVLETLANADTSASPLETYETGTEHPYAKLIQSEDAKKRLKNIRAIASDVDGTLLTSDHKLHPKTIDALLQVQSAIQDPNSPLEHFFLATGKTRPGALRNLTPELRDKLNHLPGVYIQGLYCVGNNNSVVYERHLNADSVRATVQLGQDAGLTLLGYDADRLYATSYSDPEHIHDVHAKYGEPEPIVLDKEAFLEERVWNKLLLMGDDVEAINHKHRPDLEALAKQYNATVTQAIPGMLELLPVGCNKGVGVQQLCEACGIDPGKELLVLGDGENDKEMFELAAFSIAMGNAVSVTKQVADVVLEESNNDGGAGIALEQFGLLKVFESTSD